MTATVLRVLIRCCVGTRAAWNGSVTTALPDRTCGARNRAPPRKGEDDPAITNPAGLA